MTFIAFLFREKQTIQEELLDCRKAMVEMQTRENMLKQQLSLYTEKYEGFQTSLAKSNTMFSTYKVEIDKVSNTTTINKTVVE